MQTLLLIALGAAGYAAYRWLMTPDRKPVEKSSDQGQKMSRSEKPEVRGNAQDLEQDPETGIYRTKDD